MLSKDGEKKSVRTGRKHRMGKYKTGKLIQTVADFENSKCDYFMVTFGNRTAPRHRGISHFLAVPDIEKFH